MEFALKILAFTIASVWSMRYAVRAELRRAGIFRATRGLTAEETKEVMALAEAGKPEAAKSLLNRYRFSIEQPE